MADRSGWWGTRPERGTVGHPYSALNLRLALALFGLVSCTALAGLMFNAGLAAGGWILTALAVVALVDVAVIARRRALRRQRRPGRKHSLFE